jgi:hypothetical protein
VEERIAASTGDRLRRAAAAGKPPNEAALEMAVSPAPKAVGMHRRTWPRRLPGAPGRPWSRRALRPASSPGTPIDGGTSGEGEGTVSDTGGGEVAEDYSEAHRVRLRSVAGDGRPGEPSLGPHLAALAGPGAADASRGSSADDDSSRTTPPGTNPGGVPDEPVIDHRGEPPHATRPDAADDLPPVAPGPSVRSLMTPRTRWDEERPADVVQLATRSAGDRRREEGPRRLGVGTLPETPEPEDADGQSEDDSSTRGATPPLIQQPEGCEHSLSPNTGRMITLPKPRRGAVLITVATIVGILTVAGAALLRAGGVPDQTAPPPTLAPAAVDHVIIATWRGMGLPVSAVSGPFVMGETHVSGFTQTELGAAVAAAHLSVRLDPAAGPPTFEAVLEDQVVGDVDRMAAAVRNQYRAEATWEQQSASQPLAVTPGRLVGWRTDGDLGAGAVTVHLAVQDPAGARSDFAVPLRWTGGDWAVEAAESGPFFPVTALSGQYRSFATGEAL